MSSHTPAPWSFDGSVAIHHGDPTTPHTLVALVYSCKGGTLPANAHLIAAAPELLATLHTIEHILSQVAPKGTPSQQATLGNLINHARAAIAKATEA